MHLVGLRFYGCGKWSIGDSEKLTEDDRTLIFDLVEFGINAEHF